MSLPASNALAADTFFRRDQTVGGGPGASSTLYTTSAVSGTVPLTVAFNDSSARGYASALWGCADGETSTSADPRAHL